MKNEGAVFTPLPTMTTSKAAQEGPQTRHRISREPQEPRCELCGHPVIATHCKRICLHCGFMTGCSEGI